MTQPHDAHHDEHAAGDHSPFIQHHYDDAQHQFDSGKLGIWLFLAQEVLFFSALFVAYILYRVHHPEIYSYAHQYLQVKYGAINTAVLIFSSLTAAWAVRCAQLNQRIGLIACLTITLMCACTFLVIKYIEYNHKVHEHILFGKYFDPCVSSGGNELLTKNNECPGSKSTVEWNYGTSKPDAGCYDDDKYDLDPRTPGVQADCTVVDQTLVLYKPKVYTGGTATHDCVADGTFAAITGDGGKYTFTGLCDTIQIKGNKNVVTFDKVKKVSVFGQDNRVSANAADLIDLSTKTGQDTTDVNVESGLSQPKWQQTITVLKPNDKGEIEWKIDDAEKAKVAIAGTLTEECPEERIGEGEPVRKYPCWEIAHQPAVCGKVDAGYASRNLVKHLPEFGVLVLYGDEDERGRRTGTAREDEEHQKRLGRPLKPDEKVEGKTIDTKIVATCKEAPKAVEPADVFAAPTESHKIGDKAIQPVHELTVHEEHELEAMGPPPEHTNMFFTIYFAMTGLHGIHVIVGVMIFIWLLIRAVMGQFSADYFGPVDYAALYWHIVDLIWIFLFPLLYLIH